MSHRREQKEALRRERERREAEAKTAAQRKRLFGIAGAVAIAAVAVVIVVVVTGGGGASSEEGGNTFPEGGSVPEQKEFDLDKAAAAAGCELTSNKATSTGHLTDPNRTWNYKQNPPNSGRHYEIQAEDGLYNGAPPKDTALVHSLEHGRVIIWVKPTLPVGEREQIRALFDEDGFQTLVVRRANMPYAVAATAWGRDPTPDGTGYTMGCTQWKDGIIDALRTFRDEHRSDGPEDIP